VHVCCQNCFSGASGAFFDPTAHSGVSPWPSAPQSPALPALRIQWEAVLLQLQWPPRIPRTGAQCSSPNIGGLQHRRVGVLEVAVIAESFISGSGIPHHLRASGLTASFSVFQPPKLQCSSPQRQPRGRIQLSKINHKKTYIDPPSPGLFLSYLSLPSTYPLPVSHCRVLKSPNPQLALFRSEVFVLHSQNAGRREHTADALRQGLPGPHCRRETRRHYPPLY
jgi:hypothetical protein